MKSVVMKGKNVDEARKSAAEVLGAKEEALKIRVIKEGKQGMMGIIGGEEAEIEASLIESIEEEAKQVVQNLLDKMGFLAAAEVEGVENEGVKINIKGEDMGRIIGKEGAMLKSIETIVNAIMWKITGERRRIYLDAGDYKEKRGKALERLAKQVVEEVEATGEEKVMPPMSASDRRVIHIYLKDNEKVMTFSKGDGAERRLVISPKR